MALVNLEEYGRRLRAARILAGCERVRDLIELIEQETEVKMSERTLYAIEKGKQMPTVEQYLALLVTLRPPNGAHFFNPAWSEKAIASMHPPITD